MLKGRLARSGSSFQFRETIPITSKPSMIAGAIGASEPPVSIKGVSPYWIRRKA